MSVIIMTTNPFSTRSYALAVYILGSRRLTPRDGWTGLVVPAEYYTLVEQYAAANYTLTQIDTALANGYISQQEYDETLAYIV
jgi:hypothetical protein